MKTVLILCLIAAVAFARVDYQGKFVNWMRHHGKSYAHDEFQKRFEIFSRHVDFVEGHNSRNLSFTVALNQFADLSNDEFRQLYLGYQGRARARDYASLPKSANIPDTVDWRKQGAVTHVKNQGQCGSCWSFSTTGSLEGAWKLAGNNLTSLSEQNLMDCSQSYGNQGCNGGLMDDAFKYIINNNGIDTESSYPYEGSTSFNCRYTVANRGATMKNYKDIPSGSESDLHVAVAQQPISVAIDAGETSFQLYDGGVYYSYLCGNAVSDLDHGVLAVGYGTYEGTKYWLVKNSWGATWGLSGYIMMIRDWNNNCGIATDASYPIIN